MGNENRKEIRMTDRRPVSVDPHEWPVITEASGDSFEGHDPAMHQQAAEDGKLTSYNIAVRRHEDGRAIVYASVRHGEYVTDKDDLLPAHYGTLITPEVGDSDGTDLIVEEINAAAINLGMLQSYADEAIAGLPPRGAVDGVCGQGVHGRGR